MTKTITPEEAMDRLSTVAEIAFVDLREAGPFSEGHPLFAAPCPWSGFETAITHLVPRRTTPVLLIDGGDGIAQQAAEALNGMGYPEVATVGGGAPAWAAAGFTLFKGVHVPSKTLGELAEEVLHPSALPPATLAEWLADGRDFLFYDCRPASEHRTMTVPGAGWMPNGELPHRLDMLPPGVPIVMTCAGRTRGIVGAATLGLIAPDRPVHWLEDGTQGWRLAGFELSFGNAPADLPPLDKDAAARTRARADDFMAAQGIPLSTAADVAAMQDDPGRTTFLFDVRDPADAASAPLPGFAPAPVVTLVQATDTLMAVRRARVVLADDLGLRGAVAAWWLRALGHDAHVALVSDDLRAIAPVKTPVPNVDPLPRIGAKAALSDVAQGRARFIDVRSSSDHAAGHVAGALWSIRPHLSRIPATPSRIYLIGDDTPRADLAGRTLHHLGRSGTMIVEGGMPALKAAGATIDRCPPMPLARACDVTSFAHGRHEGNAEASRQYLAWEKGLVGQLGQVERAAFRL